MITQSSSANQKRHPSTVNIPLNRDYLPIPWYLNAAFLIAGGIVATILINLSFLIVDEVPVWPYAAVGLLIYGALHKLSSQWFHERGLNLIVGHGYLKIHQVSLAPTNGSSSKKKTSSEYGSPKRERATSSPSTSKQKSEQAQSSSILEPSPTSTKPPPS